MNNILACYGKPMADASGSRKCRNTSKARFPWSVFWSGFGAYFVRALYAPGKALPGAYKARTKSAPNPLQNTLHGKRARHSKFPVTPNGSEYNILK